MTWYYTVQLIISELDVMFAKLKYNLFMFKQSPVEFFRPKYDNPVGSSDDKTDFYLGEGRYSLWNQWKEFGFSLYEKYNQSPSQAAQQTVASPIENNVYVNLGGLSLQDKAKLARGETIRVPSNSTSKAIEWGGTGVPKH